MTIRLPRYLLTLLMCMTLTGMYGQYPGAGGAPITPGAGSNYGNVGLPVDSIEQPPLRKQYMAIDELGYLNHIVDSLESRPLSSDLQFGQLHNARLGNMFSATLPVEYIADYNPGAKIGINSYRSYQDPFTPAHIIMPNRPLVNMEYGTRFGDGQRNIGIDFNRVFARDIVLDFHAYSGSSNGQYLNQKTTYNRLEFSLLKKGNKKIRDSYLHFSVYRNGEQLNGGLTDESLINLGTGAGLSLQSTNANMQLKTTNFKAGTSYKMGVDSIPSAVDKFLFAEIGSIRDNYRYFDRAFQSTDVTFYDSFDIPRDTIDTQTGSLNIYEKVGLRLKRKGTSLIGALRFIQNNVLQDSLDNVFTNQVFVTGAFNTSISRAKISINAYQELGNTSENKYQLSISRKWKSHSFHGSISALSEAPSIMANQLSINGIQQWNRKLNNEKLLLAQFQYQNTKLQVQIDLDYKNITNYIYLTPGQLYTQTADPIQIYSAKINHKLKWWILRLDNTLYTQSIERNDIVGLPLLSTRHDVSLYLNLFKKNLQVQVGAVIWYEDKALSPAFNPILNEFYIPDTQAAAQYIRVMPYLRATIDSFEFFVGADDLNNMLRGRKYLAVRNHLELDSRINLAFRWRLLD